MSNLTIEELIEIFKKDVPYNKDGGVFEGLKILRKYNPKADVDAAEHDIVYLGDAEKYLKIGLTREDAEALRNMNWMLEEEQYFSTFV